MSRRLRRTKVVTTLDPATDRDNNLERTVAVGTSVVRMNLSRGSSGDHKLRADKVRETTAKLGRHVAILGGLQGPKIRVSASKEDKVLLSVGGEFLSDTNLGKGKSNKGKAGIDYRELSAGVVSGDILLFNDGCVQLRVLEVQSMKAFTEVTVGGPLSNNKGINELGGGLSAEALIGKDKADTIIVTQISVDYLAVSFPHCDEGLNYARRLTRDAGCDTKIIAKVGRAKAVCGQDVMDDIILASDIVMVARDDLGVEVSDPELVGIQKALIRRAHQLNRVIIIATQIMESMITNPMPTRAEVMDVANAVLDGTDVVVLSTETVADQYPAEAIAAIACVYLGAEKIPDVNVSKHRLGVQFDNVGEAIAMSVMYAADHLREVTTIITVTGSGYIALMTSRISSGLPVFTMFRHERTLNLTSLYRGATPIHFDSETDGVVVANEAVDLLRDKGYPVSGDLVIVTQGDVMSAIGSTSTTRILAVGQHQSLV